MLCQTQEPILAVWRAPFGSGNPRQESWPENKTIAQVVKSAKYLPRGFMASGVVSINGHEIPRNLWHLVKPQPSKIGAVVSVTFQMPVKGGRKGGAKQVFALVAALALTSLTGGIAGGSAAKLLGAKFAAGTAGARLLAAGVSVVGGLLINALTSVPVSAQTAAADTALTPASVSGNVLQANAPIPCVIGTRKVFPPFMGEPIIELVGQDEYVSALLALSGPHQIQNVRIGSALASETDDTDIFLQTFDGLPDSTPIDYPKRYGKTFNLSAEMSSHGAKPDDASIYAGPLPVFHAMSTAESPDESWLHLLISALVKDDIPTQKLRIPFQIRMRLRGESSWRYLPELHYMDCTQAQRRLQIKFIFGNSFDYDLPLPPSNRGWIEARKYNPAASNSVAFNADAYFSAGAGNDYFNASNPTTTNVRNVLLIDDAAHIYLDEADWEPGIYDIEIKRGMTFRNSAYSSSAYTIGGSIWDLFNDPISDEFPLSRAGLVDRVNLVRLVNVKNKEPINRKNLSLIYVKARNKQLEEISATASGYVYDYVSGEGWVNFTTSSNCAANFRHVLTNQINSDPMPEILLDDASLIEWRQFCIDEAHTSDMVVERSGVEDLLRIIAACGFASVSRSEKLGVFIDRDVSGESPVQVFTSRTMTDFEVRKAYNRLPSGLRPNFKDEDYEYSGRQITVYRDDVTETDQKTEQIDYIGIVNRSKIERRARIDLRQMRYRGTVYSFRSDIQSIVCRRGSLIGVNNDIVTRRSGTARITEVLVNGSDEITGFILDQEIEFKNETDFYSVTDLYAVSDFYAIGEKSGVLIRNKLGQLVSFDIDNTSGFSDEIELSEPIDALDSVNYTTGNLVTVGQVGNEMRRLIVTEIEYDKKNLALISAVDEAPEIWQDL